ncbi:MAG: hypothetical protein QF664_05735 [Dehalococcoidia bacterium]|nr:hypothetical protein [Dehalococcoidia bacterium]
MGGRLQPGRTGRDGRRSPLRPAPTKGQIDAVYGSLLAMHGPQQWWPRDRSAVDGGVLEICLGAILTQNTAWVTAAAALDNLRGAEAFSCEAILELPQDALADLVRPSGHYNVKARKLKEFAATVVEEYGGSFDSLFAGEMDEVRERLLAVWGIGPETADAMLLYAAREPTFVVDAYSYRLFERLDMAPGDRRYDVYRDHFMAKVGPDVERLNEWHALIVRHGQERCWRSRPRCEECELLQRCPFGQSKVGISEIGSEGG